MIIAAMHNKLIQIRKNSSPILVLLVILTLANLSGGKAFAQDTLQLSLSDAISIALENNYQIRISEQELKIAQNNNTQGAAGRYPSIDFNLSQSNTFNSSEFFIQEPIRNEVTSFGLTPSVALNWILFDGFRVNITKDNLQTIEELTSGNAALIVENTVQSIILAYYNVLLQNEKLKVFEEIKVLSRDRYKYEETRKQFGSAVTFDVLQANDAYLSDSVNFLQQELNLQNAELLLKLLLALDEETRFVLTDDFQVETYDFNIDTLKQKMLGNNRTIMNQYINQRILENTTKLANAEVYPYINLGAGGNYSNSRVKNNDSDPRNTYSFGYYVNFTLGFNIYNGGATKRAIQNALIEEDIGLITISELTKTLTNQLLTQYDLYEIRKNLLAVAEASQESTGLNLQISEEKFKTGAINSFNFRDIQLRYINSSIRKLEAVYDLIDTETELLRLTGGIISEE
jgi:outer membrane protein TolC